MHFIYASTNYLHTLTEALRRRCIDPRQTFPMMKALTTNRIELGECLWFCAVVNASDLRLSPTPDISLHRHKRRKGP
jgi:hypothetical protein